MNQRIGDTCNKLTVIADVLYRGDTMTGIADMGAVIPDLAIICDLIQDEAVKMKLVQNALAPILQAMEERDGIMLADVITYELLEILRSIED